MNKILYTQINVITILILSIVLLSIKNRKQNNRDVRIYTYVVISIIIISFLNCLTWLYIGESGALARVSALIVNFIYFSMTTVASMLSLVYALSKFDIKISKRTYFILTIPIVIVAVMSFVSIFNGILFDMVDTADGVNQYVRGKLYLVQPVSSFVYIFSGAIISLVKFFKSDFGYDKRNSLYLTLFFFIPIITGVLQVVIFGLDLIWSATSVGLLMLYLNLSEHDASFDYLTNVYNKGMFEKSANHIMKNRKNELYFIMIDIDYFKKINDSLGHKQGDRLLSLVSEKLKKVFGSKAIIGRLGGDEFGVLITKPIELNNLKRKCDNFLNQIHNIYKDIANINFSASIGITTTHETSNNYSDIYDEADKALYISKERGRDRYTIYSSDDIVNHANKPIMLICDDDEINRVILSSFFENKYNIIEAKTGREALNAINLYGNKINRVLLDLLMPQVSGYELLHILNKDKKLDLNKIVLITIENLNDEKILELGVKGYIQKPFDPSTISSIVE